MIDELPYRTMVLFSVLMLIFGIGADMISTFFLFRDFPDFAVNGEQNKLVVSYYKKYGLDGIFGALIRNWSAWIALALLGSFLSYFSVTRYLSINPKGRVIVSVCLGLSLAVALNFGAGISNTYLYIILKHGG